MKRPIFLNLFKMKFPPMAILSIMHRVSGVLLFLLLPFALYLLDCSLRTEQSFAQLAVALATPGIMMLLLWVLISASAFHLLAGIRHLIMDCGVGEHLNTARRSAYLVMALEVVVMILSGVWLWG